MATTRNAVASTSRALSTSSRNAIVQKNGRYGSRSERFAKDTKSGSLPTSEAGSSTTRVANNDESARSTLSASHLPTLEKAAATEKNIGKALVYSNDFASGILSADIPTSIRRSMQFAKRPTTILRKQTLKVLEAIQGSPKPRVVHIRGRHGAGRSTILLQSLAASRSFDGEQHILYIPDAHQYTDSSLPYSPPQSQGGAYEQSAAARSIIERFLATNAHLTHLHNREFKENLSAGMKDASKATASLARLLSQSDVPILIAIDGVEGFFGKSKYLNANARPLDAEALAVPRLFQDVLAGRTGSGTHTLLVTRNNDNGSQASLGDKSGIREVEVDRLQAEEAAGIFAHLAETNQLLDGLTDAKLWETYVATDGNVQKFTRGLRAVPGTTSRGNLKKGRSRGTPQRADKMLTVTL